MHYKLFIFFYSSSNTTCVSSYVIQHFQDTFRQCIIDMIHGNLYSYNELQDDDVLKTVVSIAGSTVDVPNGYYEYGALSAECRLAEAIITSTRFAHCETPSLTFSDSHRFELISDWLPCFEC